MNRDRKCNDGDWPPTAPLTNLRLRAALLAKCREFFVRRGYWEVETPLLSADVAVDAHIEPFLAEFQTNGQPERSPRLFMQTSPEFAMKRLLAAGADAIFQISRAFRNGECGVIHNPECTLVEWYRVGMHYHDLMTEVGDLVREFVEIATIRRTTYRDLFVDTIGLDPFLAADDELLRFASRHETVPPWATRDDMLNVVLAADIEPRLKDGGALFVHDFPASQAALARVRRGAPDVAERFELYLNGIELCNGYQELTDPDELMRRAHQQNKRRLARGGHALPVESRLLAAMRFGLPECAGVALGFDRLVMIAVGAGSIDEVVAFPFARA